MRAKAIELTMRIGNGNHNRFLHQRSSFNNQVNDLLGFGVVDDGDVHHAGRRTSRQTTERSKCSNTCRPVKEHLRKH